MTRGHPGKPTRDGRSPIIGHALPQEADLRAQRDELQMHQALVSSGIRVADEHLKLAVGRFLSNPLLARLNHRQYQFEVGSTMSDDELPDDQMIR